MQKRLITLLILLSIKTVLAGPVTINLSSNDIWFPSMILGINEQCRLNQNGTKSRPLCDDSRVVDQFTQIATGTIDYEFGRTITLICPEGWQNVEGGNLQYQLRVRINGQQRRCGRDHINTNGAPGDPVTANLSIYAFIRVNDWTNVQAKTYTVPITFNIDY